MKEKIQKTNELKVSEDYYLDMFDLLGTEDPTWSPKKVKELLQDLIKSGFIFKIK